MAAPITVPRIVSRRLPWIDDFQAEVLEIGDVARDETEAEAGRRGPDLQVDRRAGAPAALRFRHHLTPADRHDLIERQQAAFKLGREIYGEPAGEPVTPASSV